MKAISHFLRTTILGGALFLMPKSAMLSNVPAYGYLKQAGSSMMGLGEIAEPRGARANRGAWRLAGQTDMVGSGLTAVFVPNSPNTFSGSVFLLGLGQGAATRSAAGEHPSLLGAMRQVEGRLSTLSVTIGANQLLWVSVYEACGRGTLEREQF
jgi:hypothetical protein